MKSRGNSEKTPTTPEQSIKVGGQFNWNQHRPGDSHRWQTVNCGIVQPCHRLRTYSEHSGFRILESERQVFDLVSEPGAMPRYLIAICVNNGPHENEVVYLLDNHDGKYHNWEGIRYPLLTACEKFKKEHFPPQKTKKP
jgi:hypothetical protein